MGRVTYLFGAGASCLCLPLVEEILQSLRDLYKLLEDNIPTDSEYEIPFNQMLEDLRALIDNAKAHSSIDTYAKKNFIIHQGNNAPVLSKLKFLLSICLIYEQIRYPSDYRYDTFFASILKDSADRYNGDIRILSWNYDYQFEKAHNLYTGGNSLLDTQKQLPVISNEDYKGDSIDKFSIFKINGTAAIFDPEKPDSIVNDLSFGVPIHTFGVPIHTHKSPEDPRRMPGELAKANKERIVKEFLELYSKTIINETIKTQLNFAWESKEKGNTNPILRTAINSIKDSDALVIIGYSFPFFNRNIDQRIIGSLHKRCKIYIQNPNFDDVASNLESISKIRHAPFIQVKNMNQFYLPGEL